MKNITLTLLSILILPSFVYGDEIADLKKRVKILEEKISAMKSSPQKGKIENDKSMIKLIDWNYSVEKSDFGDNIKITYTIKNNYKKGIKLIDGSLYFSDLLGEQLINISMEKDSKIKPGESKKETKSYMIITSSQRRLEKMKKEDIVAKIEIGKVILEDNTIIEVE